MARIIYQDLTIEEEDVYEKTLQITGGKKSDWTSDKGVRYDHVNVTVSEPYHKDGSFGRGSSNYRYGKASDLDQFLDFNPPFTAKAKMFTATDNQGKSVGIILSIDFASVQEKELVNRQTKPKPATTAPSATVVQK